MSTTRIGRYEIVRPLGKGAMGVVYLARDPQIEREVALKTVRFDSPNPSFKIEEAKARFLKEARISGRLQHPHIVTVFDVGEDGGNLYLAMEYVPGGSFSQRLQEPNPLSIEERIRVVAEVAQALGHAPERGVIHRDVKPANILLTQSGSAKVTDFGIGKLLTGDTELTSTGQMVGSPAYMSPEQIRGEKLDVRSDIFSLGVVLYQALTDRKPFPADTLTTLVYQILHEEPAAPGTVRNDLPTEISAIVRKCLAKNREDRYSDAVELSAALGELLGYTPVGTTASLSESKVRRAQRAAAAAVAVPPAATVLPPGSSGDLPTALLRQPVMPPKTDTDSDAPTISVASGPKPIPTDTAPPSSTTAPPPKRSKSTAVALGTAALLAVAIVIVLATRKETTSPPKTEPTAAPTRIAAVATPGAPATTTSPSTASTAAVPVPTESIRVIETPLVPTPSPTRRPRPTKAPVVEGEAAKPTPVPTPSGPPADLTLTVRRVVKINVNPDQARVFLDGKYIGISDDWDGSGGGALLVFNLEGKHHLRMTYPGRSDLNVDLIVARTATEDKVEIDRKLEKGVPDGPTGPEGKIPRPSYKTVGPVRFTVEPPDALVTVNGKPQGPAKGWFDQDLRFADMAVYDVELSAPGYQPKAVRVIVSPATEEVRATIREKLKKR